MSVQAAMHPINPEAGSEWPIHDLTVLRTSNPLDLRCPGSRASNAAPTSMGSPRGVPVARDRVSVQQGKIKSQAPHPSHAFGEQ